VSDTIEDPIIPVESSWEELEAEARELGYEVRLVEHVECADTPGLLGQANGSIAYGSKIIRVKETLGEAHRLQTLAHELEHARDPENGEEIDRLWHDRRVNALGDELERELLSDEETR
jgi:hypothetical protein